MKPVSIYSISGSFSEEEKATIFAKCARSPELFSEIAKKVDVEGASQFHEKYVINYGHSSVAEMAVPNFCFEGVSILASKILESMPRGAYQEKSTRAQNFLFKDDHGRYTAYYIPTYLKGINREFYVESMNNLFSMYEKMSGPMQKFAQKITGSDKFVAQRRAFDSLRYLLPIGTQTNLAMRINGRDLSILISKLLSSNIHEFVVLGNMLKKKASEQLPTLVRHANVSEYMCVQEELGKKYVKEWDNYNVSNTPISSNGVGFAYSMSETDALLLTARMIMCHHGTEGLNTYVNGIDQAKRIVCDVLEQRGKYDDVPEEIAVVPTFWNIVVDYGAYRDLQRHRRLKQFPQLPSTAMGFSTPDDIIEAGFQTEFEDIMNKAAEASREMKKWLPEWDAHLYMIPLAYRYRTTWCSNLEQDFYVIELRSKPQGHISYRTIACEMHDQLQEIYPTFSKFIRCVRV